MKRPVIPILLSLLGLFGCSDESRIDVSQQAEFRHIVGMQYEVVGSVDAYGIRPHSQAAVEYVTLIPPPGIEGPEVGFRIPLQVGSKLIVQKVIKTNRMFDPNMSYEVRLEGTQLPTSALVRLDLFRGNEGESPMKLNPKLYRGLNTAN